MATIKSFTDIPQSKKLAEILPIESADMWWSKCTIIDFGDGVLKVSYAVEPCNISQFRNTKEDIPCWSLAALFNILPDGTDIMKDKTDTENEKYMCSVGVKGEVLYTFGSNPIDVCYEMVLRLHELKML